MSPSGIVSATAWSIGTLDSHGENVYYECAGTGSSIVFSHGLGGNHAVFFQQMPVFARDHRVVTWDQRGFGRSTNRRGEAGPVAAATDLGALLDHLEIDRAHLVGQSMGGWAVLGFALRSPERVASLIITDSTAGVMTDRIAEIVTRGTRAALPEPVLGSHPAIGSRFSADEPVQTFLYQQIGSFRDPSVTDAEMVGRLYATRYPTDQIQALELPVLLVVGACDDLIPPAAVHELGTLIRGSRVVEIPGAGHSPYFECPEAWNDVVLSFLSEVEGEQARGPGVSPAERGGAVTQNVAEGITVRDGVVAGPLRHSVNQAHQVSGSIHNDAVASKLGFRGGTVAGSIHLELFPPVLIEVFGEHWFERGTLSINFRNPTTDREGVRAFVKQPADRSEDVQVDVWIEREDGLLVGEGTASVGDPQELSALQQIDVGRFEAKSPRILASLHAGDTIPAADVDMAAKAQDVRLDVITEVLDCYTDPARWGGLVASPGTMVHYLYAHPARVIGRNAGTAVGLFGAIELRNANGPLVLDRTYRVSGEILAVGESPKTEYVWFESYADTPDGERVAEMRMQLRWMKASSPLYQDRA